MTLATYITYPWAYGSYGGSSGGANNDYGGGDDGCCGGLGEFISLLGKVILFVIVGPFVAIWLLFYLIFQGLRWLAPLVTRGAYATASATRDVALQSATGISELLVQGRTGTRDDDLEKGGAANFAQLNRILHTDLTHEYDELAQNTIRLLVLEPSLNPGAKIECHMEVASLDSQSLPQYDAVSYCWGASKDEVCIKLNGRDEAFPASAVRCLHSLRGRSKQRTIWIDAICINQFDLNEKGHQVAIMGDIYRRSTQVVICLATKATVVRDWLSIETSVASLINQAREETGGGRHLKRTMFSSAGAPLGSRTKIPSGCFPPELRKVFEDAWFTRLWVVQEAILAPRGVFMLGMHTFDMIELLRAAAWLQHKLPTASQGLRNAAMIWKYADREFGFYAANSNATTIPRSTFALPWQGRIRKGMSSQGSLPQNEESLRSGSLEIDGSTNLDPEVSSLASTSPGHAAAPSEVRGGQLFPLTPLLRDFLHFHVTRDCDRIFALYGLCLQQTADNHGGSSIQPDYTKATELVYRDATRATIQEESRLDILGSPVDFHTPGAGSTWIPRWNSKTKQTDQAEPLALFFKACGKKVFQVSDLGLEPSDTLYARGKGFDRVQASIVWPILRLSMPEDDSKSVQEQLISFLEGPRAKDLGLVLVAGATYNRSHADIQQSHERNWDGFKAISKTFLEMLQLSGPVTEESLQNKCKQNNSHAGDQSRRYLGAMKRACVHRRFLLTESGRIGLGPLSAAKDDRVCILNGRKWPFLLRQKDSHWNFVGPAYVCGVMRGEAQRLGEADGVFEQIFEIR